MAGRNVKRGLMYFRLDCDIFQDRKVKRLMRRWQNDGLAVYLALLCEIYRDKGYYITADDDLIADIADTCLLDDERTTLIYNDCIDLGLFDRQILKAQGLLTSKGIQARYLDIMAILRRKGGIDTTLSLISSEEIPEDAERIPENSERTAETAETAEAIRGNAQKSQFPPNNAEATPENSAETVIYSDNREREDNKADDKSETDIHTPGIEERKGGLGENQTENDRLAQSVFNRGWNELEKHERMYLWMQRNYPIMLEFERPLTLDNCRSITDRIADWHDVERLMESIANRRDVLSTHTSAIATFNSFARMDVVLARKQKI